jgi:hypothetical protein
MHQRQKALLGVSVAPPSSGSLKKPKFNRFKEGSFRQALALARRLNNKGWGAIVASEGLKKRLETEGISKVVCEPGVANKNEIIMERSLDHKESCYCAFIKFGTLKATAFFTDPSHGEAGRALKKKELMRRRSVFRAKNRTWAGDTANEILETEKKKPRNKFIFNGHDHSGENVDNGMHRDDGVSSRKSKIRQFKLWGFDWDAGGYHNWVHLEALEDMTRRENAVGMTKIPSTEFTMPFNEGAENGPHLNIWGTLEALANFWKKFLLGKKHNVMPGLAASVNKRDVLKFIERMRKDGEMALGVAHPSCILNVVVKRLPVGLLNILNERDAEGNPKYNWRAVWSFVEKYVDAVGEFNPTLEDYPLRFQTRSTQRYFKKKVDVLVGERMNGYSNGNGEETAKMKVGVEEEIRKRVKTTESTVSYAFAQRMKEKFGTIPYFDHDLHVHGKTDWYWRAVSPLAYGRTVFTLDEEGMRKLREEGGVEVQDVIEMLHKKTFRGGRVEAGTETFLKLDNGGLRPVAPRRDWLYGVLTIPEKFSQAMLNVKLTWRDLKKRNKRIISTEA